MMQISKLTAMKLRPLSNRHRSERAYGSVEKGLPEKGGPFSIIGSNGVQLAGKNDSCSHFHCVITDRLIFGFSEGVAIAYLDANELRTDHAALITIHENKRPARPARRLKVRIVLHDLEFVGHTSNYHLRCFLK